jgi:hypothetical protein
MNIRFVIPRQKCVMSKETYRVFSQLKKYPYLKNILFYFYFSVAHVSILLENKWYLHS